MQMPNKQTKILFAFLCVWKNSFLLINVCCLFGLAWKLFYPITDNQGYWLWERAKKSSSDKWFNLDSHCLNWLWHTPNIDWNQSYFNNNNSKNPISSIKTKTEQRKIMTNKIQKNNKKNQKFSLDQSSRTPFYEINKTFLTQNVFHIGLNK